MQALIRLQPHTVFPDGTAGEQSVAVPREAGNDALLCLSVTHWGIAGTPPPLPTVDGWRIAPCVPARLRCTMRPHAPLVE
jgi:hypothetical protein